MWLFAVDRLYTLAQSRSTTVFRTSCVSQLRRNFVSKNKPAKRACGEREDTRAFSIINISAAPTMMRQLKSKKRSWRDRCLYL